MSTQAERDAAFRAVFEAILKARRTVETVRPLGSMLAEVLLVIELMVLNGKTDEEILLQLAQAEQFKEAGVSPGAEVQHV